jgi:mannose-1-phosphate guanylyltransferase
MIAVVLVGGFGTRLRPLTYDVPKPMLPVGHRPMIVGLVERLGRAGITDVVLALGFKPEPFASAFVDGRCGDVRVHYAVEPEPLDTGGAIAFAARDAGVDDTFVVVNGDIITDVDTEQLIRRHRSSGAAATLHLTPVDDPSAFGVVELESDGTVRRFVEKPAPGETDSNLINAGTYVFEPSVLDHVPHGARVSVERDVFPRVVADGLLAGLATDDYWIDAGRPELYLQANLDMIRGRRTERCEPVAAGTDIDSRAMLTDTVVETDVVVGADAVVEGSLLLPGARVAAGSLVRDSIVAGHVGEGASVERSVIGQTFDVPARASVTDERVPRSAPADQP